MSVLDGWAAAALETTIPQLFSRNVTASPDRAALTGRDRTLTWRQAEHEVHTLAAGLAALGLQSGQTLLLMMSNRIEHWLLDVAATHLGIVPSTLDASKTQDQVHDIAEHSRARVVVIEGTDHLRRWSKALRTGTGIEHVVVLDEAAMISADHRFRTLAGLRLLGEQRFREDPGLVRRASAAVTPGHPAVILYVDDARDQPRGVVLTHRNVCYAAATLHQLTEASPHSPRLCYLPLSHISERMIALYAAIHDKAHVYFCADREHMPAELLRTRPTLFFAAPEEWSALAKLLGPIRDEPQRLRARLGLDRVVTSFSGATPINADVREFFSTIGLDIYELWGMTETTGCVTTNHAGARRPGTAGQAVPGMEVRTAADGEVLVRGPLVCAGYLQPDGLVRPVTGADGWLHTGDAGVLDADGFLTITFKKPRRATPQ